MKKWLINLSIVAAFSFMGYSCGQSGEEGGTSSNREQEETGMMNEDVEKGTSGYDTSSGAEFSTRSNEQGEMNTNPDVEDGYIQEDTSASTENLSEEDTVNEM